MDNIIICRRRNRSEIRTQALALQLAHIRQQYHFEEVVLSTEGGDLLANSGSRTRAMMIAAVAPEGDPKATKDSGMISVDLHSEESTLTVTPFEAEGTRTYLSVLAAPQRRVHRGTDHAMTGIRRIISTTGPEAHQIVL